jgi:hypothetical protein
VNALGYLRVMFAVDDIAQDHSWYPIPTVYRPMLGRSAQDQRADLPRLGAGRYVRIRHSRVLRIKHRRIRRPCRRRESPYSRHVISYDLSWLAI